MPARFYGVIVPLITPFKDDLSLDLKAVRWLVRYQVKKGVHGIFPNSTVGEFVHLSRGESVELVKTVLDEVGSKVWVIPGISANYTENSIELGKIFKDMGVDGAVIMPPFFFKLPNKNLKLHFSKVAEKVDLPLILYDIPVITGVRMPIQLYVELAKEYSNIVGAKITSDSFTYFRRLINEVKNVRKDFAVLTGFDDLLLPVLMIGGDGGVMALANVIPQIHRKIYDAWMQGNLKQALKYWRKLLHLTKVYDYASSFPSAVKTLLKVMGAPIKPHVRTPLTSEEPSIEEKISNIAKEIGLKVTLKS